MDLSVSKKIFFQSLSHFQSVVEKRNTIPILSNLKLKAYNGSLEVTATDLALEISEKILANIKTEGELTIPSQLLFDIVRKAPEDSRIELREESESGQVFIFFGDSKFSLPYLPTSDFPEMEEENLNQSISLDSKKLSYLLNDTKFSMGVDESRQYLNGIYFHHIENKLIAVATDGHRLSKCQVICEQNFADFEGIIIPKKTVFEITKILENVSESIKLSFSKTKIKLDLKNLILTSKLLNANFPDYESVIPKKNELIMKTDSDSFAETIDRVSTVSSEKFRTVKLDISENLCVVSSFGQEKSAGTEQLKVEYSGPNININFNAKYILDVLSILKKGEISLSFSIDTAPTVLESIESPDSLYLIMQMRS